MALLIFDLDGTLLDSIDGLAISMNKVLESYELPTHDRNAYLSFVGNGIEMLVQRALPETHQHLLKEALERMIGHYKVDYVIGLKPYEGIYSMLDQIVEEGHRMALVTNKFQFMAEVIMPEYFGQYPFEAIIGRSEENPAKPDPTTVLKIMENQGADKDQTYMIGDTEVDLDVARNAGINEVFVSWGFRKLSEVAHKNPKKVIHHPMELLGVL